MLPGFSKITAEMGNLRDAYIHAQTIVFAIGAPVAIGVWLVAEPAVLVFLGPDWSATIPLVKVISLFALIQIIGGNAGSVFIAISRPQLQVPGQIAKLIVLLPALYWSITTWGVIGAAWSVTAAANPMWTRRRDAFMKSSLELRYDPTARTPSARTPRPS